jgi:AcrR family transcriptional regulator
MSSGTNDGPRRRAPRGTLNRDLIVATAIKVIDADGLDALTTRRLSDDLGVRPMALYKYFADKDAILRAVAEELFGRFEMPERVPSDREMLRQLMRSYFRLLVDHPVLLQLDAFRDETNNAEIRSAEALYACFKALGIDHREAIGLVATFVRFVVGSATLYPGRRKWDEDPDHWKRQRQQLSALPPEVYPAIHDVTPDFPAFNQEEVFEFGLEKLLCAVDAAARG